MVQIVMDAVLSGASLSRHFTPLTKVSTMTTLHLEHPTHEHAHGPDCGHTAVQHGDHVDYAHDGHLHREHSGHWDDH